VYLGYWVAGSRKMSYKTRFRPLEGFGWEGWQSIEVRGPRGV
jgi:arginine-tRNA-protein transferase